MSQMVLTKPTLGRLAIATTKLIFLMQPAEGQWLYTIMFIKDCFVTKLESQNT